MFNHFLVLRMNNLCNRYDVMNVFLFNKDVRNIFNAMYHILRRTNNFLSFN